MLRLSVHPPILQYSPSTATAWRAVSLCGGGGGEGGGGRGRDIERISKKGSSQKQTPKARNVFSPLPWGVCFIITGIQGSAKAISHQHTRLENSHAHLRPSCSFAHNERKERAILERAGCLHLEEVPGKAPVFSGEMYMCEQPGILPEGVKRGMLVLLITEPSSLPQV